MKKLIAITLVALTALSLSLSSCKKNDKDEQDTDDTGTQTQHSGDESLMQIESENSLNEVNTALSGSTFGKTGEIAGATIVDSPSIKTIFITYNGTSADGKRTRTGEVTVQLVTGNNWGEAGAQIRITYTNLKITHVVTGKSVTLNGYHLITNVTGGRAFISATVTHTVRGAMQVSFDNTTSRNWQVARRRVVNSSNGAYDVTISGDTTIAGLTNIVIWGTNRFGSEFYTQITQPIVFNSTCPGKPVSGVKNHKKLAREITVTFGVDASGNPVSGTCPYGYKINWTNARNVNKTAVISY
ncbi:MAG: hypothetical protein V4590_03535 [Bacteroidota bacterium]